MELQSATATDRESIWDKTALSILNQACKYMWQDIIQTPQVIKSIYGDEEPVLSTGIIRKINIENGTDPTVGIGIEPINFPKNPPKKWLQAGYNTCIIGLRFTNVLSLMIDTQHEIRLLNVTHEKGDPYSFTTFKGDNAIIKIKWQWIEVSSINAYQNEIVR